MDKNETQSEKFELKLEGNGISVKRSVDASTAWRVLAVVMDTDGMASAAPGMPPTPASQVPPDPARQAAASAEISKRPGGTAPALREFLDAHEPSRNVEKIVAIATYLKVHGGKDLFTREDVKKGFRTASEPVPGNYGRDFNWARSAGWIANTDNRGEYYVTETGRKAVEANFPAEVRKASAVGKNTRKRRAKGKPAIADE